MELSVQWRTNPREPRNWTVFALERAERESAKREAPVSVDLAKAF